MKKILVLLFVLPLLFGSCDFGTEGDFKTETFWVINLLTSQPYQIEAELLASEGHINVWVEKGSNVTPSTAMSIARFYNNSIHNRLIDLLGLRDVFDDGQNIMQIADAWGNEDRRLCVLLYTFTDGFDPPTNRSTVAGYFAPHNFYIHPHSNNRDMIHMNINPRYSLEMAPGLTEFNRILAHEVQHLMNYAASLELSWRLSQEGPNVRIPPMDIWIDEGISEATSQIIVGPHDMGRINWFNDDETGLISQGNNFFVWDNRRSTGAGNHPSAILDDYATTYLFFQWLRIHGGTDVFADIYGKYFFGDFVGYELVTAAASWIEPDFEDWDVLLKTWMAANFIGASEDFLGYNGEITVRASPIRSSASTVNLFPGEGVFSLTPYGMSNFPTPGNNIIFAGLQRGANADLSTTGAFTGTNAALLSLNVNTNDEGPAVPATISGVMPAAAPVRAYAVDSLTDDIPLRIGARDLLRRDESAAHTFTGNAMPSRRGQ